MHHVRGCMFAHRRALQAFVNTTAERFFVFEDDVTLPDAPLAWSRAATSEFVAAAKGKDLGYLGHCFDGLCTHALLWSRAGAQKALSRVRWCTSQNSTSIAAPAVLRWQLECTLAPNARVTRRTWGDGLLRHVGEGVRRPLRGRSAQDRGEQGPQELARGGVDGAGGPRW